jgi:putative addiction module component (TIGR02574 family)
MGSGLLKLPLSQRLELVQDLWDSIAAEQQGPVATPKEQRLVAERLEAFRQDGHTGEDALRVLEELEQAISQGTVCADNPSGMNASRHSGLAMDWAWSLRPSALVTLSTVAKLGLPSALSARYKLSRLRPVSFATCVIPLARAISPRARAIPPTSSGASSSQASR